VSKKLGTRISTLLIAVIMIFTLAACGGKNAGEVDANMDGLSREYIYVPTFTPLKGLDKNSSVVNSILKGDKLYYSLYTYFPDMAGKDDKIVIADVADLSKQVTLDVREPELDGFQSDMNGFQIDEEGNFYVLYELTAIYADNGVYGEVDHTTYLVKYDDKGNIVYEQDLKNLFQDKNSSYIQSFQISKDGKLFAACNHVIYVLGADGVLQSNIPTKAEWIHGLIATEDGRLLYSQAGNTGEGMELVEIDTDQLTVGATYKNIPEMSNLIRGSYDGRLLVRGSSYLYEYDFETQKATPVLSWSDSDIAGDYVADMIKLKDDNFLLLYKDPIKGSAEIVKLTKTKATELPEKEVIVYAALTPGISNVDSAIDDFNKRSNQYKIVKKTYYDDTKEWSQERQDDALALMHADITGDNPPDIIDLSQLNINDLAKQSVLEDLTPYLEKSNRLSGGDFVPSVLNAYTINDKLVTIPRVFYINTLMAKTALVGEEPGWTLDELIKLADTYPEADLFVYMTKQDALQTCIQYNSSAFADYKKGICSFDTPEFIKVLEFANRFEENQDNNGNLDTVEEFRENKILLNYRRLGSVSGYQIDLTLFGEPLTFIGYPTSEGSNGAFIEGLETLGITANSSHKKAAWTFLESYLGDSSQDVTSRTFFSSRSDELDEQLKEAMTTEFDYRETKIYPATQEQVDEIKSLIEGAKRPNDNDADVLSIINEEAEAYFKGQKSAEDVAKIIQSRVSIYVSENS